MSQPPGGLYIHIPFCARICPYCDFAVRKGDADDRRTYVEALLREIELWSGEFGLLDTIYFGGGTPSALTPEQLSEIVVVLQKSFSWADDTRIFLEANPEDVDATTARAWRELGVETLSLGVQSLDDIGLRDLGRAHSVEQLRGAVSHVREAGFKTLSIDLIYGRPGQTVAVWQWEMQQALELQPDHLSAYQLTIHPRTRFGALAARGKLKPLSEVQQGEFFRVTHRTMEEAGMFAYEVSQFARSTEHHSRHNIKYWQGVRYLGLGPSAHSFDGDRRWWNRRKMGDWLQTLLAGERPIEEQETLTGKQQLLERLMIGFRTTAGVDTTEIKQSFGVDLLARNQVLINEWQQQRLVCLDGSILRPTLDGLAIADSLAVALDYELSVG